MLEEEKAHTGRQLNLYGLYHKEHPLMTGVLETLAKMRVWRRDKETIHLPTTADESQLLRAQTAYMRTDVNQIVGSLEKIQAAAKKEFHPSELALIIDKITQTDNKACKPIGVDLTDQTKAMTENLRRRGLKKIKNESISRRLTGLFGVFPWSIPDSPEIIVNKRLKQDKGYGKAVKKLEEAFPKTKDRQMELIEKAVKELHSENPELSYWQVYRAVLNAGKQYQAIKSGREIPKDEPHPLRDMPPLAVYPLGKKTKVEQTVNKG